MIINLFIKDKQVVISGLVDKVDLNPSLPNCVNMKKGNSSIGTPQWERINSLSLLISLGQISYK
mgnify:CR=1 FL=1